MKHRLHRTRPRLVTPAVSGILFALAPTALAQTTTVTYDLDDVWLLPDISHPGAPARLMTGSFTWTFSPDDFENGSGQFLAVDIPWYGTDLQGLDVTFNVDSIELTLAANLHDHGLDITIRFLQDLSPAAAAAIDPILSSFDVEVGISHKGHIVSGSAVPRGLYTEYCGPAQANSTGSPGAARALGSSLVADNDVVLEASGLPDQQFGYLLASRTQGFIQNPGGSQGSLCLGGEILRFVRPGEVGSTGGIDAFSLTLDLADFPSLPPAPVMPGEEWNFQA